MLTPVKNCDILIFMIQRKKMILTINLLAFKLKWKIYSLYLDANVTVKNRK